MRAAAKSALAASLALCRRSAVLALVAAAALAGCGGGGGGEPAVPAAPVVTADPAVPDAVPVSAANVVPVTVERGPFNAMLNVPFVSVTVCQPGTDSCRTVDHVMVDTASYGLRLSAAALGAVPSLPAVFNAAGEPVAECAHFASGFAWGSVRRADIRLGGERAASLPLQVIGDKAEPYANIPAACRDIGPDFGASSGVNGILGLGVFKYDCPSCAASTAPGVYFTCSVAGCKSTTLPLASQVTNPVAAFAVNNNGAALVLPSVPAGGTTSLAGSLIFGIGTQANNQLGLATVFTVNSQGNFSTLYKGTTYSASFIDSGSNGIFFSDPAIPACSGFYCPPAPLSLTAVNTSSTGVSGTVAFTVESIQSLVPGAAAANVGADIGLANSFDWGLPFFFGRTVFVAISGASTPKGVGPYWAY